jgi:peptide/nickel transport system ATP-binding protein
MSLLSVKNLKMYYTLSKGYVRAVDDVSFEIERGETLALVGESGCGKTSVAYSLIGLLPPNGRIVGGNIIFDGVDLVSITSKEWMQFRWKRISMIFQGAMNALDPVRKVGDILIEAYMTHFKVSKQDARAKIEELFEVVGLPKSKMDSYPHEYSGGMKQRAIIALSLVCNPKLIIADEPTTALDVIVQDQILEKIKDLQKKLNISMLLITHDISIVAERSDKIAVMYGGEIVEHADTFSLFEDPRHPYTAALLNSFPNVRGPKKKLSSLAGLPPDLRNPPKGCRFEPRCPCSKDVCRVVKPRKIKIKNEHYSLCHFALDPKLKEMLSNWR